jgi:glucose-6-phosphate 1-dehydrogenase
MATKGSDPNSELKVSASVSTPDLGIDPLDCLAVEPSDPCTIVILGATGDLTARKLVPALFDLYLKGGLPQPFQIMGCGRTDLRRTAAAVSDNGLRSHRSEQPGFQGSSEKSINFCRHT